MPLQQPISENYIHICVDAQKMFLDPTPWHNKWLARVLPQITLLTAANPARTIFTRFIVARNTEERGGTWGAYYRKWEDMTLEKLGEDAIELAPELRHFTPPARLWDKHVYSPWAESHLNQILKKDGINTLIISGGETDVCVLSTVMGAVDYGYRVIIARDALCSSCDETHDKVVDLYHRRFAVQVEPATTEEILSLLPRQ